MKESRAPSQQDGPDWAACAVCGVPLAHALLQTPCIFNEALTKPWEKRCWELFWPPPLLKLSPLSTFLFIILPPLTLHVVFPCFQEYFSPLLIFRLIVSSSSSNVFKSSQSNTGCQCSVCFVLVQCVSNRMTASSFPKSRAAVFSQLSRNSIHVCRPSLFLSCTHSHSKTCIVTVYVCLCETMRFILRVYVCFYYVSEWLQFVYVRMCVCARVIQSAACINNVSR